MTGLWRYALLGLPSRRRAALALVAIAAAGTALFVAAFTMKTVVNDAFAERAAELNKADLLLQVDGDDGTIVDLAIESGADEVLDIAPISVPLNGTHFLATAVFDKPEWVSSRYLVVEGRAPMAAHEVAADKNFLSVLDVGLGQQLTVDTPAGLSEVTVVGSIVHALAERSPSDPGVLLFDPAAAPGIAADFDQWIIMSEPVSNSLRMQVELLPDSFWNATGALLEIDDTEEIEESYRNDIDPMAIVLTSLGSVAAMLLMLLIATLTAGQILGRRREFGVLRSLGWTPREVRGLVGVETALPALLGALVGVPLGLLLARWLAGGATQALGIEAGLPAVGIEAALAVSVATAAAALAGLMASGPSTRPRPAALLRAGRGLDTTGARRSRLLDRMGSVPMLGLALHFGTRPRGRTILVALSLVLATSQVSTLVHYDSLIDTFETQAGAADRDFLVVLADGADELAAAIRHVPGAVDSGPSGNTEFGDPFVDAQDVPSHKEVHLIQLGTGADPGIVREALASESGGAVAAIDIDAGDRATLRTIQTVVRPVTLILLLAAIGTLVVMVAQRVREQRRDLAILSTGGLAARRRLAMVLLMAAVPTACAIAIGIPLGAPMLKFFMVAADGSEFTSLITTPSASAIAISAIAMMGIALATALPLGLGVARQRPAAILRHVD